MMKVKKSWQFGPEMALISPVARSCVTTARYHVERQYDQMLFHSYVRFAFN
jgi:hypothetical protein